MTEKWIAKTIRIHITRTHKTESSKSEIISIASPPQSKPKTEKVSAKPQRTIAKVPVEKKPNTNSQTKKH